MMSSNTIRDKDVLGLQEIVSGQNLEDKIASAGAAKDIYDNLESTKTEFGELKNLVMRFEYIGSGVDSEQNERPPYFGFSTCSEGLYFVRNISYNATCYGAITWVTRNDTYITFSQSTRSEGSTTFSASGYVLYGSSLSWYSNMYVWKVFL